MNAYSGLNRAQLSYEYLHTNSTTHEFLFGALAELLDNARDANATKMEVFTVPDDKLRGGYMLCFLDNGEGMDPNEANGIINFGKSNKRVMDSKMIGQYGNGLKSGAMRIGNDFILFTKKDDTMTCVFLSRSFHEEENLQEVVVPLPSFDRNTQKPYCCNTAAAKYRFNAEMNLILKYSPFKDQNAFMKQFDYITGDSGTLVIVYNMKLLDSGEPELLSEKNTSDITLNTSESERDLMMPERWSFRSYASVLYAQPYMKIYIEGKKVRTKLLQHSLYKPRVYKFSSTRFKERSKKEAQKALHDAQVADMRAKEADSKARQLEKTVFTSSDKNARLNLRKAQDSAEELRDDAIIKKKFAQKKQKDEKLPKILEFIFGLNLERRTHDGMFIYNCSRLIKMYQKVGPQTEGGLNCNGVVGVVDVPYQVLEPTHNKQDFADAKEYRHLLRTLGEHMEQYWKDVNIVTEGATKFWESYGYLSDKWQHPPSDDSKFVRKRAMATDFYLQCDDCLKWRIIPFSSRNINRSFDDKWTCNLNTDFSFNKCSAPEQKTNLTEGKLIKDGKSKEDLKDNLEKKMEKIKIQLNKVKKNDKVPSPNSSRRNVAQSNHKPISSFKEDLSKTETIHKKDIKSDTSFEKRSSQRTNLRKVAPSESKRQNIEIKSSLLKKKNEEVTLKQVKRQKLESSPSKTKKRECDTSVIDDRIVSDNDKNTVNKYFSSTKTVRERRNRHSKKDITFVSSSSESESEDGGKSYHYADSSINRQSRKNLHSTRVNTMQATSTSSPPNEFNLSDEPIQKKSRLNLSSDSTENDDYNHKYNVGVRVEVLVEDEWQMGTVDSLHSRNRVNIRLDKCQENSYDRLLSIGSSDLRLSSQKSSLHSTEIETSEAPSSSTTVTSSGSIISPSSISISDKSSSQIRDFPESSCAINLIDEVSKSYRNCLKYFLPPHWTMNKDEINELSPSELSKFPLSDFVDHYEIGIKKIMDNFQHEVESQKQIAELENSKRLAVERQLTSANKKLCNLRKSVSKLLKSSYPNKKFKLNDESDSVDRLVEQCLEEIH